MAPAAAPLALPLLSAHFETTLDLFLTTFSTTILTLEQFADLFAGAPKSARRQRAPYHFQVRKNGDCLSACLFCAAFMAKTPRGYIEDDELLRMKVIMVYAARTLKTLFKSWIIQNKDLVISTYAETGVSVSTMLGWQNDGDFNTLINTYQKAEHFAGELELNILCHLCPTLRVQIKQPGTEEQDTFVGCQESPGHTVFLKREHPSSTTKCHYNMMFWRADEGARPHLCHARLRHWARASWHLTRQQPGLLSRPRPVCVLLPHGVKPTNVCTRAQAK